MLISTLSLLFRTLIFLFSRNDSCSGKIVAQWLGLLREVRIRHLGTAAGRVRLIGDSKLL